MGEMAGAVLPFNPQLALAGPYIEQVRRRGQQALDDGKYAEAAGYFELTLKKVEQCYGVVFPDRDRTIEPLAITNASQGALANLQQLFQKFSIDDAVSYKKVTIERLLSTYLATEQIDVLPHVFVQYVSLMPGILQGLENFMYRYVLLCAKKHNFGEAKKLLAYGHMEFEGKEKCLVEVIELCNVNGQMHQLVWFLRAHVKLLAGSFELLNERLKGMTYISIPLLSNEI